MKEIELAGFNGWMFIGGLLFVSVVIFNAPPIAQNETYVITEDMPLSVAAPGVLANDSDPDGDLLSVSLHSGSENGSLSLADNGAFVYTPTLNYWGYDQFSYIVSDGVLTATATTSIQIIEFIDPPVVDAGQDQTVDEGSPVAFDGSYYFGNQVDLDPADADTIIWYFGDGNQASGSLSVTHTYTESGIYTATLYVLALQEFPGYDNLNVTVLNVAPVVVSGENKEVIVWQTYTGNGAFSDPGEDTWTATVDYNDGMGAQDLLLTGKNFALDHTFSRQGVYQITVSVFDDDGGVGTDSFTITVKTIPTFLPVVFIGG